MSEVVTISILPEVQKKLDEFKTHPDESYNSVIERLIYMSTDHEPLSDEEIDGMIEGLQDLKEGKVLTEKEFWGNLEEKNES